MNNPSPEADPRNAPLGSERWIVGAMALMLAYAAWAWGGTRLTFQAPLPLMALAILILALTAKGGGRQARAVAAERLAAMLKDPATVAGALFLLFLALQWLNAGRVMFFNPMQQRWEYSAPAIGWLPSAISRPDASEMLAWFFPAWSLMAAIRGGGVSDRGIIALWKLMAGNGAVLALFGICLFLSGTTKVFGLVEIKDAIFFGSFGYANHAGAFFTLMFCLSSGLCVRELYSTEPGSLRRPTLLWLAAALTTLAAATLSLSRIGMLLAWTAAAVIVVYTIVMGWRHLYRAQHVKLAASLVGIAGITFFAILSVNGHAVIDELTTLARIYPPDLLENIRLRLAAAAVDIWREAPWFGAGGWGFSYLVLLHLPGAGPAPGMANIHCDPLQFLVEFGLVGTVLMGATVFLAARPLLSAGLSRYPLLSAPVLGLIVTAVHSLVDLPFRCPAILLSWLAVLAGAGVLRRERYRSNPRGNSERRGGSRFRFKGSGFRGRAGR